MIKALIGLAFIVVGIHAFVMSPGDLLAAAGTLVFIICGFGILKAEF